MQERNLKLYFENITFRNTVYIEQKAAWYDLKTHAEIINLKFFSKITKSIGTAGLTGLDRLFCFMIVTELQVYIYIYLLL